MHHHCSDAHILGAKDWQEVVELLERLSLVEVNNQEGVDRLTKAVHSANLLHAVNTDNVQPVDSVLEDR